LTNPRDNSSGTGGANIKETIGLSPDAQNLANTDGLAVSFTVDGNNPQTLGVSGNAWLADYLAIFHGGQYNASKTGSRDSTPRLIEVTINDGTRDSNLATVTVNVAAPAGVAGSPINLALTDPALAPEQTFTATITDLPAYWMLNLGTDLGNGTWI